MREYLLTLLVTAAVTFLLTPLVRRVAIMIGAIQAVRDRDVHVVPIPRLGGLAMYGGLAAGLFVAGRPFPLQTVLDGTGIVPGLLLAGGLIVAIGIIDDRFSMNAISKLAGQVAAGAILVASGCELNWIPTPGGGNFSLDSGQATVLTILVVVATINAVNFIDGLDGLAAGIVGIAALAFFIYYYTLTRELRLSAEAVPALASAILAGMCLGFLPHNFFPARIFMGDTGSMLLGLLLAYAPISSITSLNAQTLSGSVNRFPEVLPLLLPTAIMVVPYADMVLAVIRRTRAGTAPWAPDRKHLHHRLLDIGHSHRLSVLIMYLWAAVFSSLVVWFSTVKTPLFAFAVVTLAAVLALLMMTMPRLRWWERGRRPAPALAGAAGAGAGAAGGAGAPGGAPVADRVTTPPAAATAGGIDVWAAPSVAPEPDISRPDGQPAWPAPRTAGGVPDAEPARPAPRDAAAGSEDLWRGGPAAEPAPAERGRADLWSPPSAGHGEPGDLWRSAPPSTPRAASGRPSRSVVGTPPPATSYADGTALDPLPPAPAGGAGGERSSARPFPGRDCDRPRG